MSAPIVVRPATADDVPEIQAVEVAAGERFREVSDPRIARCADATPYSTAGLERASIERRAWVAVDDGGSIVGFAVAWVVDGEGHLDELAVTPSYGRRGVGRALVDEVVAWTVAQELASITLTTFRDVPWNGPYYEKLGFRAVSTLTPALQALVDEQATWGLDPSLRVVMRRSLPGQSFLVRPARVADASAIGEVHVRAWQAAYRGVMPDEYLDALSADERAAMWRDRMARDDLPPLLVAEAAGVVVGFAAFGGERPSPDQRGAGELGAINLDPAHWGKGIGRSLLREVTSALSSLGYREAILWVVPQNLRARSLYEREGWLADGAVATDEVLGVTVTEMRYRTELHG